MKVPTTNPKDIMRSGFLRHMVVKLGAFAIDNILIKTPDNTLLLFFADRKKIDAVVVVILRLARSLY